MWIGAQAEQGVARAGRLGHGILLSGALAPARWSGALTTAHETAWIEGGRRGGSKPRVAALRNLWITTDAAERAAVLDWQRASYVLYQGLGWAVAESDAGAAMDFAGDAAAAIETAVATTIIGSVDEVIDGLHEVADAGVDDVVLRIAVEGAPQEAIHTVMRDFADGVFPVLADDGATCRAPRRDAAGGPRSRARRGRRVGWLAVRLRRRGDRHRIGRSPRRWSRRRRRSA